MPKVSIEIEEVPKEVHAYLERGPRTECWMNATPDDPSGEIKSNFVNFWNLWPGKDRLPPEEISLVTWQFLWKVWQDRYDKKVRELRNKITDLEQQLRDARRSNSIT